MTDFPSYPGSESDLSDGITEENRHDEVLVSAVKWRTKYREIFNENKVLKCQLEELQSRAPAQRQIEPTEAQVIEGAKALRRERGLFGEPTQSSITAARACLTAALSSTNCGGGK